MGRPLTILLCCALCAAALPAQDPAKPFFEERLLDRSPVIVRARFDADQSCFDVEVAAFRVVTLLRGTADGRILVLGAAQLSKRLRNVDRLLFLRREPSGCLYRIVDAIDLVDEADAIEAMVRGFLGLVSEVDPARKREGLKRLIRDGLAMKSEFPRRLAARELQRLARRTPPVLSLDDIAEFEGAIAIAPADETAGLRAALEAAENGLLRGFAGTQSAIPPGPKRIRFAKAVIEHVRAIDARAAEAAVDRVAFEFGASAAPFLIRLLDDDRMRPRALLHLGALQWRAVVPDLIARLGSRPADAGDLIACLGEIGDQSAVPAVSRFLSTAEHFDAAAIALARIGSPGADGVLDAMLRELRKDPRQLPRVETLQRVRSAEFRDADAALRMEAKGRYPRE